MQKKIYPILLIMAIAFFAMACEEEIQIDVDEADIAVVIEGGITDLPGPHQIHISYTVPVYSNRENPPVVGAQVTISDDAGNIDTLVEISPGVYQTTFIEGVPLRTYSLSAIVDGINYEATYQMQSLDLGEDSLTYQYLPGLGAFLEEGYYVSAIGQEPAGVGDYYTFKFIVNDSAYDAPEDLFFFDDAVVDGNQYDFVFPYPVEVGDTVVVEALSMNREEYDFLVTWVREIFSAGSPFGSPPANLSNNISNSGLGFFYAHSVVRDTVIIE